MPDDRLFHKRLGHSAKVNSLTDFEDLVWRAYVLSADDFGVMRFSALTLQADHDRLAKRSSKIVQKALERVRDARLIATFEHQGRMHCASSDWQNHQRVKHPRQTINPKPTPDLLMTFTHATRALFNYWPGKKRETFGEDSRNLSETSGDLARAGACETLTANANGSRLEAHGSEPFDSFEPPGNSADPAIRAGAFLERYKALHLRLRKGAHYVGKPHFDFQEALQLVGVFDDATLDKLAYVWLNTDHPFAESGTRTLAKFRSMASWCQEQVLEFEQKHGVELVVRA
jgi:hypothetical protein